MFFVASSGAPRPLATAVIISLERVVNTSENASVIIVMTRIEVLQRTLRIFVSRSSSFLSAKLCGCVEVFFVNRSLSYAVLKGLSVFSID